MTKAEVLGINLKLTSYAISLLDGEKKSASGECLAVG
jgi:hypothetical protein